MKRFAVVPRFYFHLHENRAVADEEGRELPDLEAARRLAIAEAREMMRESILEGRIDFGHRIEIADEAGAVVGTVTFKDAVAIEG